MHHAGHCSTQRFFERRKCRDATGVLRLVGSLRRLRAFGRAGTLIGDDTLAQKSASTVLRQTFGAYNPRKKCLVSEILFDRSQRLLAGQKHRARPRRVIARLGRNSAPEIPLPKPCGLGKASASARGYPTQGKGRPKRKSLRSKYVRGKNANTGENRTCVVHRRTPLSKARLVCRNWAQRSLPSEIGQGQSRQNTGWNLTPRSAFAKAKAEKISAKKYFRRR